MQLADDRPLSYGDVLFCAKALAFLPDTPGFRVDTQMVLHNFGVYARHAFMAPSEDILMLGEELLHGVLHVGCHLFSNPSGGSRSVRV